MLLISGSKNSPGKAATHSRFPHTQAGSLVNLPFHCSTTGKSTKALCIWLQGVLPCITVSRSGMEASWQLFMISFGDVWLQGRLELSKDQQLSYQSKGNWYNWKQHLKRKGVAHYSPVPRTRDTLSTGTPFFSPVWGRGTELGWTSACPHTHYWAPGFMLRPLKIPALFLLKRKSTVLVCPERIFLYFIFHPHDVVWFLQWQRAQRVAIKEPWSQ